VVEHPGAQVEDQTLTDRGRAPPLHHADHGLKHGQRGYGDAEDDDQPPVPFQHAFVDDLLEQQRRRDGQRRRDHHQSDEADDQRPVGPGEGEDAAYHAAAQPVLGDIRIG
jgi:hypothetical protein